MTGKHMYCALVDGSIKMFPLAKIQVDTPYYTGSIEAMCIDKPIHDLIIGNLPGATTKEDPNWQRRGSRALAVITRAQHQREQKPIAPLKVTNVKAADVDFDKLKST